MSRIAILGIALAASGASGLSAQAGPIAEARQLTASYTLDLVPSPDGRRAVYIRVIGGREQLFTMAMDGTGEKQITFDDADHEDPAWSPDGSKIAFVLVKGGKKVVHLVNPDGSGAQPVTPATQSAIHPSFTPDGRAILYCTDDDLRPPVKNESAVYSIDLASRRVTTLISGGVNTFPVMSPDGTKIAYRKIIGDMNSEVFIADADGRNPRNLTNNWTFEGWPAWSPDGRTIAFAGNRNNAGYQIFLMDPDGSNVRLLAATEGRGTAPKWTPDGRSVLFTVCRNSQERRGCDIMLAKVEPATRYILTRPVTRVVTGLTASRASLRPGAMGEETPESLIPYDEIVQEALRDVVGRVLREVEQSGGLPGGHHFYITFKTRLPGVSIPRHLVERFPDEMTIVLQHRFWDLKVEQDEFSVGLSFGGVAATLTVPFAAVTRFHDPAVEFSLTFQAHGGDGLPEEPDEAENDAPQPDSADDGSNVVSVDFTRKK